YQMRGNRSSEQATRFSTSERRRAVNHQEWNRSYSSNQRYPRSVQIRPASARSMFASESFWGLTKVPAIMAKKRAIRLASVSRSEQKNRQTFSTTKWLCSSVRGGSWATSLTAFAGGPGALLVAGVALQAERLLALLRRERLRRARVRARRPDAVGLGMTRPAGRGAHQVGSERSLGDEEQRDEALHAGGAVYTRRVR